jgi:hypothetical protein
MDRLGWDLGNPAGGIQDSAVNFQGVIVTNRFHPMKGVMVTTTLQDIMGHEPFHWRGDRADLEAFNTTFTNLQGAAAALTPFEMRELKEFLASIRLPPNPYSVRTIPFHSMCRWAGERRWAKTFCRPARPPERQCGGGPRPLQPAGQFLHHLPHAAALGLGWTRFCRRASPARPDQAQR